MLRTLARAVAFGDEEFAVEAMAVDVLLMDKPVAPPLDGPIFEAARDEIRDNDEFAYPELQYGGGQATTFL